MNMNVSGPSFGIIGSNIRNMAKDFENTVFKKETIRNGYKTV